MRLKKLLVVFGVLSIPAWYAYRTLSDRRNVIPYVTSPGQAWLGENQILTPINGKPMFFVIVS
jgi:hypothetical protein